MAGSFITVTPSGHEPVLAYLQQLQEKSGNLQPVLADIGELLLISHRERWQQQVDPQGRPWEPLAPETIERKGHDLILREHDFLRDLLNYQTDPMALYFGTPQDYGQYPQFGEGQAERQWLGVSQDDPAQILDLIAAYLVET